MQNTLAILVTITALLGCEPSKKIIDPAAFAAASTIILSESSRCTSNKCSCRSLDSNAGQVEKEIPAGKKRFEFRLPRTTSALWVEVEGRGVFYKEPKLVAPQCFYVDLGPGTYPITVHGKNRDEQVGLQLGVTVYEYGPKEGPHWYKSLHLVCGGLGRCDKDGLRRWSAAMRRLPRGVLDPCGSVMVKGTQFAGTRAPDKDEYAQATVKMTMKVYAFETYRPPMSSACKAPIKNR